MRALPVAPEGAGRYDHIHGDETYTDLDEHALAEAVEAAWDELAAGRSTVFDVESRHVDHDELLREIEHIITQSLSDAETGHRVRIAIRAAWRRASEAMAEQAVERQAVERQA